jgi:hypothetical protein
MKCTECAEGKRITSRKILCLLYGMIIREYHECDRPGAHEKSADEATPADPPEAEERKYYA